ncbi:hypothetical protein ACFPRL_04935 [Pseudoclavibacter helvolus]
MTGVQPPGQKLITGRHVESAEELVEEVGVERVARASCEPEQHREACVEGLTAAQSVGDDAARVGSDGGHSSPGRAGDNGSVAGCGVGDLGSEGG